MYTHMNNVNRLRPMPSHLIKYEGEAIVIANLAGFIGGGVEGFYYRHTGFLSKMRFTVDGESPRAVSANPVDSHSLIAYYLAVSPAGERPGRSPTRPRAPAKWSSTVSRYRSTDLSAAACTTTSM
jgi:hypothetical protein